MNKFINKILKEATKNDDPFFRPKIQKRYEEEKREIEKNIKEKNYDYLISTHSSALKYFGLYDEIKKEYHKQIDNEINKLLKSRNYSAVLYNDKYAEYLIEIGKYSEVYKHVYDERKVELFDKLKERIKNANKILHLNLKGIDNATSTDELIELLPLQTIPFGNKKIKKMHGYKMDFDESKNVLSKITINNLEFVKNKFKSNINWKTIYMIPILQFGRVDSYIRNQFIIVGEDNKGNTITFDRRQTQNLSAGQTIIFYGNNNSMQIGKLK